MPNAEVDLQVKDALTISNVKTIAEAGSIALAQIYQHQVNHARRLDLLAEAHMGKVLNNFTTVDPAEAVATAKLFKGESDSSVLSLLSALSGGQISAKIAQSTPGDLSGDIARLGATVAAQSAQLGAVIALVQQVTKSAQTTPPVTSGT